MGSGHTTVALTQWADTADNSVIPSLLSPDSQMICTSEAKVGSGLHGFTLANLYDHVVTFIWDIQACCMLHLSCHPVLATCESGCCSNVISKKRAISVCTVYQCITLLLTSISACGAKQPLHFSPVPIVDSLKQCTVTFARCQTSVLV